MFGSAPLLRVQHKAQGEAVFYGFTLVGKIKGSALAEGRPICQYFFGVQDAQRKGHIVLIRLSPTGKHSMDPIGHIGPINNGPRIIIYLLAMLWMNRNVIDGNLSVFSLPKLNKRTALNAVDIGSYLSEPVTQQRSNVIVSYNPN